MADPLTLTRSTAPRCAEPPPTDPGAALECRPLLAPDECAADPGDDDRAPGPGGPRAAAGASLRDEVLFAEASVSERTDARLPLRTELGFASARLGAQSWVELGGMRATGVSPRVGRLGVEALTARIGAGTRNVDGSYGGNLGALVVGAGIEGTRRVGAGSVTGGLSLSAGAEVAVGVRDVDRDGHLEYCARVSVHWLTLGACVEPRGISEAVGERWARLRGR